MTSWGELEEIINGKIEELVTTGGGYLTPEEYKELLLKEYKLMLTEPRTVKQRNVVLTSRVMKKVTDDNGDEILNPYTGLPLEVPTNMVCEDFPITKAKNVRGLEDGYITNVEGNGDKLTVTWGDGDTKDITVSYAEVADKIGTATVGSGTNPVWVNTGTVTRSTSTVGSNSIPVWFNAGVITACSSVSSITDQSLGGTGYVVFSNGLVLNWARLNGGDYASKVEYEKPIEYNTYVALTTERNEETGGDHTNTAWIYGLSTTTSETFETQRATAAFNVLIIGRTV